MLLAVVQTALATSPAIGVLQLNLPKNSEVDPIKQTLPSRIKKPRSECPGEDSDKPIKKTIELNGHVHHEVEPASDVGKTL